MQLSEAEREDIVHALRNSLPNGFKVEYSEEWREELNRRSEVIDRNPSSGIPWEEVKKRIWQRLEEGDKDRQ